MSFIDDINISILFLLHMYVMYSTGLLHVPYVDSHVTQPAKVVPCLLCSHVNQSVKVVPFYAHD